MKRIIALVLTVCTLITVCASCSSKPKAKAEAQDGEYNVLFIGDAFIETSKIAEYFGKICKKNGRKLTVDYVSTEKAGVKDYAERTKTDKEFTDLLSKAEIVIFGDGRAEADGSLESVQKILSYANDPTVMCIAFYGYPRWMYRHEFEEPMPEMLYADGNTILGKIIAAEDFIIAYQDIYEKDERHPNALNGYLTALIVYCELFAATPEKLNLEGFEADEGLVACFEGSVTDTSDMKGLFARMHEVISKYI